MHGLLRSKDRDAGNHVCAKPQGSTGRPGCDINCCAPLGPSAGELMKPTQPVQTLQASSPSRPPRQAFSAPWNKPTAPRPPSPLFTLPLIGSSFAFGCYFGSGLFCFCVRTSQCQKFRTHVIYPIWEKKKTMPLNTVVLCKYINT